MKHLIVSIKTSEEVLNDFKRAYRRAKAARPGNPHYEISFDNQKEFDLFVRNIPILSKILLFKPKSIYELAKILKMDTSNLNKIILFFEEMGAIKLKEQKVSGRSVRTPIVEYDRIKFNLAV
jgi:predicted transcriptional regulator